MREERRAWRDLQEGAYLLRTNLQSGTAEELWSEYMQLTEAESTTCWGLVSETDIHLLENVPGVSANIERLIARVPVDGKTDSLSRGAISPMTGMRSSSPEAPQFPFR